MNRGGEEANDTRLTARFRPSPWPWWGLLRLVDECPVQILKINENIY
jgi:hypothetical protein